MMDKMMIHVIFLNPKAQASPRLKVVSRIMGEIIPKVTKKKKSEKSIYPLTPQENQKKEIQRDRHRD